LIALLDTRPDAHAIPVDWDSVESWLSLRLPTDYKELASTYGPLDIGDYIWVQTPCHQDGQYPYDYADWLRETHRQCRIASRDAPPFAPPLFHPAAGGLLAWGYTRGATYLFWDTGASPDPDQWPVVAFNQEAAYRRAIPWQRFDMPMLEMLTTAVQAGIPLPRRTTEPLPAKARRSAWLFDPVPWTPPPPTLAVVPEAQRRFALTEGGGLQTLSILVPPPDTPYLGDGTWGRLFDDLGTSLPAEFVALMNLYGAGTWKYWLTTFIPLRQGERTFAGHAKEVLDGYRWLQAEHPHDFALPTWPEPSGFLPFADSLEGDVLGWLTEGAPDTWPLLVFPRHADQGPPLEGGLIGILLEWARGNVEEPGLVGLDPDDDPLDFAYFQPSNPDSPW